MGKKCHKIQKGPIALDTVEIEGLLCKAEEAYTRTILHAKHAAHTRGECVAITSSDTDVVVLVVYFQREVRTEILLQLHK